MWSLRKGTVVGSAEDLVVTDPLLPCGLHDRSCFQSIGVVESRSTVFAFDRNSSTRFEGIWTAVSGGRIGVHPCLAHLGTKPAETSACAFHRDRWCTGRDSRRVSLAGSQTQLC